MAYFVLISILIIGYYCILIITWKNAWNNIPLINHSVNPPAINLSIIIPVRNEEKNIEQVLISLLNQQYPKHLFEIIISDDYSNDNTIAIAKDFFERHLAIRGNILQANPLEKSSKK